MLILKRGKLAVIVAFVISAVIRPLSAEPITISAPGITLTAQNDAAVAVSDQSGVNRLTLGGYRLVWTSPATDTGTASLVTLPGGEKAIKIDYKVKGDPTGSIRIQGQYTAGVNRVHIRYDLWGPDTVDASGAMIGCVFNPPSASAEVVKLGRWVRQSDTDAPYEVSDGSLFVLHSGPENIYLNLHGNTDWRDQWSVHFPAQKTEPGHFVAEGDLVITPQRPAAAGAILAGRPIALDVWTDQPNNLWDSSAAVYSLKTQTVNLASAARTMMISWIAHDFSGAVVAKGEDRQIVAAGNSWDRPISIPAPAEGIVFVDVTASNGKQAVFVRTNLATLPERKYLAGDSIFGISAYFPLPDEDAAEKILKRIGCRWVRNTQMPAAKALELGMAQNYLVGMPPSGKPDDYNADPAKKAAFISHILSDADSHGAVYLELFNEWNMVALNTGTDADMYVKDWLLPVDAARKSSGAKVKLMSMGLAGVDTAFLSKMHDAGGWDLIDALAIHTGRGWYTPDYGGVEQGSPVKPDYWNFLGSIETANDILAKYGRKELWITEAYACTPPNNAWYDTYHHAAEDVVLSYALAMAKGVRVMDWYQLNDSVWYDQGGVSDTDTEYHYGLLNHDLSPKPSLLAYATIAAALDQAHFVRWLKFGASHTQGLLFDTPRGKMCVLWDRTDGYRLNTEPVDPVSKKFISPEPWVNDWKTTVAVTVPTSGKSVQEIDCIGRQRQLPVTHGSVMIKLDGAPKIYYGLQPD